MVDDLFGSMRGVFVSEVGKVSTVGKALNLRYVAIGGFSTMMEAK